MSVYVGIDVHSKRSRVAVIDQDGEALANRNVPSGVTPILSVIGDLPSAPGGDPGPRPAEVADVAVGGSGFTGDDRAG